MKNRQVIWKVVAAVGVIAALQLHCVFGQFPSIPSTSPVNVAAPPLPSTLPLNYTAPPLPLTPPVIATAPSLAATPPPPPLPSISPLKADVPPLTTNPPPPLSSVPILNTTAPPLPATPPVNLAVPPKIAVPPASLTVPPLPTVPQISPSIPPITATRSQSPETFIVGDTLGWTVPPAGAAFYSTWTLGKTFLVGDTLYFNFTTNKHTVATVTKTGFDSCTNSSFIGNLLTMGPAKVVLEAEGDYYYICTFKGHCHIGQKLAITVNGTATPPSASPSSASFAPSSRVTVTDFFVYLLTTTIVVFFL
ncbi:hypothetical protein NE237_026056 [Protea cynaroides]|uniref:Phytocyanin domain-containing protein n=1 Tax=Protea cynaroides TaxID=273540 RepID=A0A9Q0H6C8_9MAGN|nr:hypothetical protein NE237_026056 [Protea cynaroides]